MNAATSLEKYTKAVDAVKAHTEANSSVFTMHKSLMMQLIDAENELRDAVAEAGAGVSNAQHRVTITPQEQTWGDIETLKALEGKTINAETIAQIVKTQKRPPRITITEQKPLRG